MNNSTLGPAHKVFAELGVSRSKANDWIARGYVPVFAPEGRGKKKVIFVDRLHVEQFIKTGKPVSI